MHIQWAAYLGTADDDMDTYIPPNIRLINPISKRFTPNWRFIFDELPSWVEQSQDLILRSTVLFLIITYSGTFLSFNHLLNWIFSLSTFIPRGLRFAGWLSVCNWHSINTNYYRTTLSVVPRSFNSDQIECMCSQNRPHFRDWQISW